MNIAELDQALKAVCPVSGVSIGDYKDKTTWRIDFLEEATAAQKVAAQAVLLNAQLVEGFTPVPTIADLTAALVAKGVLASADIAVAQIPAVEVLK